MRRSYVNWQEPQPPRVVVEILSAGTEAEDLGRFYGKETVASEPGESDAVKPELEGKEQQEKPPSRFAVYEQYLRVPHYLVYSRQTQQLRCFHLSDGAYAEQSFSDRSPLVWFMMYPEN